METKLTKDQIRTKIAAMIVTDSNKAAITKLIEDVTGLKLTEKTYRYGMKFRDDGRNFMIVQSSAYMICISILIAVIAFVILLRLIT